MGVAFFTVRRHPKIALICLLPPRAPNLSFMDRYNVLQNIMPTLKTANSRCHKHHSQAQHQNYMPESRSWKENRTCLKQKSSMKKFRRRQRRSKMIRPRSDSQNKNRPDVNRGGGGGTDALYLASGLYLHEVV